MAAAGDTEGDGGLAWAMPGHATQRRYPRWRRPAGRAHVGGPGGGPVASDPVTAGPERTTTEATSPEATSPGPTGPDPTDPERPGPEGTGPPPGRSDPEATRIAYYSMEIAIDDALPTFSGGLGVLAGDHLRAAADRSLRIAGVSLLYRHGFFRQSIADGEQREAPVEWSPEGRLEALPVRVTVQVGGRTVAVGVWRTVIVGAGGSGVPVYFLDTALEANEPEDRAITDRLYTSDPAVRLRQEAVLGFGGPLVLEALGHRRVRVHHMNEGHGSLVPLSLLARSSPEGAGDPSDAEVEAVRAACVFTTHTPVPAGHDRFDPAIAEAVLGRPLLRTLERLGCTEPDGTLNMTLLGMQLSATVNAVSLRHRDVTRQMFPGRDVESITNGVHSATWAAPATAGLFDAHLPGWRRDSAALHYATAVPLTDLAGSHRANKEALCAEVRRRCGSDLHPDVLTIGIARRFAAYKRNDLVVSDLDRLGAVAEVGPLQLVFAGKAHPMDPDAKAILRSVVAVASGGAGPGAVKVAFVEDYGMALGRLLCAGSDVWLNTPAPPNEASGTSGMKAALNGVPSLSTLDGWWLEGWVEGVTGWAIPGGGEDASDHLYRALEESVVPLFYKDPEALTAMGRHAIALNGSFFSAHRMVDEYARRAYRATPAW